METNGAKPSTRNSIDLLFDSRRRIRFASTVAAPLKRKRDRLQAQAIAQLVSRYLTHLPYDHQELTALHLNSSKRRSHCSRQGADED